MNLAHVQDREQGPLHNKAVLMAEMGLYLSVIMSRPHFRAGWQGLIVGSQVAGSLLLCVQLPSE